MADDEIDPAAAVRAYRADLAKLGIRPYRTQEANHRPSLGPNAASARAAAANSCTDNE